MSERSSIWAFLHGLDREEMRDMPAAMLHPQKRERYALMARRLEAWSSAKRDGVAMPREEALAMLKAGRAGEHNAEKAIWKRYRLMTSIEENPLKETTADDLQHYAGILDLQIPPDAMDSMRQLINGDLPGSFMHPLLRAFTVFDEVNQLHVEEPDVTALFRALFYRVMLRHEYTVFRFLALSTQDDCFIRQPPPTCEEEGVARILTFMSGIDKAKDAARHRVADDEARHKLPEKFAGQAHAYNHRQRLILAQALADPNATFTMDRHRKEHGVAYATARADLYELRDAGLLAARKQGKAWVFSSPSAPVRGQPERPVIIPPTEMRPEKEKAPTAPERASAEKTWYFW